MHNNIKVKSLFRFGALQNFKYLYRRDTIVYVTQLSNLRKYKLLRIFQIKNEIF